MAAFRTGEKIRKHFFMEMCPNMFIYGEKNRKKVMHVRIILYSVYHNSSTVFIDCKRTHKFYV